jgi:hypothetical protein
MAPLCWATYVLTVRGSKYAQDMWIITCVFQIFGTIAFLAPELLDGCMNMQPFGVHGCLPLPPLTPFYGMYFYFAVGANFIWIFVPLYIIACAMRENAVAKLTVQENTLAKKQK